MSDAQAVPGKQERSTLSAVIELANPAFVVVAVCLPIGALLFAQASGSFTALRFVHIMAGVLWCGIDLFMGFVLGPALGMVQPAERAAVFKRLTPRMTFLMPVLAAVTATAGIQLTEKMGLLSLAHPWVVASLVILVLLNLQGFGMLLPNEIRVFRELLSDTPDVKKIARLGMRNAMLGGVQGVFQLAIIIAMVNI